MHIPESAPYIAEELIVKLPIAPVEHVKLPSLVMLVPVLLQLNLLALRFIASALALIMLIIPPLSDLSILSSRLALVAMSSDAGVQSVAFVPFSSLNLILSVPVIALSSSYATTALKYFAFAGAVNVFGNVLNQSGLLIYL